MTEAAKTKGVAVSPPVDDNVARSELLVTVTPATPARPPRFKVETPAPTVAFVVLLADKLSVPDPAAVALFRLVSPAVKVSPPENVLLPARLMVEALAP